MINEWAVAIGSLWAIAALGIVWAFAQARRTENIEQRVEDIENNDFLI